MTKNQAAKRFKEILADYKLRYASGGKFGFDVVTLIAQEPQTYRKLKILAHFAAN